MVLLDVLKELSKITKWEIVVAHFNHRLRGRAGDADERLVRKTAASLKLPIVVGSADVKPFAAKSQLSLEMAARKLRHEFLARTAQKHGIKTIALAHHADDQVELFFLRLLRGTGGEGLGGMRWCSPSPADDKITLVRPLLGFPKFELLAFAQGNKIRFREDATNSSVDFLRNRVRNQLLPLLREKYQPALDKTVLRLMEIIGTESDFMRSVAANPGDFVPDADFSSWPVAIQRRVLHFRLIKLGVVPDFDLIESLRRLPGTFVSVGSNISVARNKLGEVKLRAEQIHPFNARELPLNLSGGLRNATFGEMKLNWRIAARVRNPGRFAAAKPGRSQEYFDAAKVGLGIILRHWRPGDRFQPIGFKSEVKLQDLFVNAKIARERRRTLVLAATTRGEIFWVEGLRIGERFKLAPRTSRILVWKWSKLTV